MNNLPILKNAVDEKELNSLDDLDDKYKNIIEPGIIDKATEKISAFIPENIKKYKDELSSKITEKELFIQMMKLVNEGFSKIEETASKYSLNEEQIIKRINKVDGININKLEKVDFLKQNEMLIALAILGFGTLSLLIAIIVKKKK